MAVTITEIGTYAGQVTPTTITADPDFSGNDSLRYAVDVTLGAGSTPGDAIFTQIATHYGGISWSAISGRFTITDSAGNTYERFGDASVISGCRHGVINFVAKNAAAISGTLEIRIKGLKLSAVHASPHDLPFCVQVTKVSGLNFPASFTSPNAGASTGSADAGVSGGSVSYNTQAAITNGVRYFAVAALAYEKAPSDSISETANSFSTASTSEVSHLPGTTDAGSGFADHYNNLALRVRFREGTSTGGNFGPTYTHTTSQGTAHYGQLVAWFAVTDIAGDEIDACHSSSGLCTFRASGGNVILNPHTLGSDGRWDAGADVTINAGSSPSIRLLSENKNSVTLSLAYVDSGVAKWRRYLIGQGAGTEVTIGSATLVDHCIDRFGRLVAVLYDSGWKVSVLQVGTGGLFASPTTPVSMGITADAAKGRIQQLPDGYFYFSSINGGSAQLHVCRSLENNGSGTWSVA